LNGIDVENFKIVKKEKESRTESQETGRKTEKTRCKNIQIPVN
jgi:hypothetical protein